MKFPWIITKILQICKYYYNKHKYGCFEKSVSIIKPLRILGKKNIFIKSNVRILNNSRIEAVSVWGKEQKFSPKIIIGKNTSFEQDLHLICANSVKIGNDCVFSARVFISDLNHVYQDVNTCVMKQPLVVKDVEIGDGCFVGYGACILPGVHLGKHCVVGANAVVTKSFPDYCVLTGNPAICIKRYSTELNEWRKTNKNAEFI